MVLNESDLAWYDSSLKELTGYFKDVGISMQRLAICETGDLISVICDSKIIISMDNQSFNCTYSDSEVANDSGKLCSIIQRLCSKLVRFNYKIRQIAVYCPSKNWNPGYSSGEVIRSTDKVGEKVVMLTCR